MQSSSPLLWSLPVGSLFATRIRVSLYFPLLLLVLVARFEARIALALTAIFLLSTLFHELVGHVLVARSTGGEGSEVLLWPIGGLAWVQPAPSFWSQFLTAAGGPLVNLAICILIFPALLWDSRRDRRLQPLHHSDQYVFGELGPGTARTGILRQLDAGSRESLADLSLDGGRMVEACLIGHGSVSERRLLCLRIGMIAAIIISAIGLMLDNVWVVFSLRFSSSSICSSRSKFNSASPKIPSWVTIFRRATRR